VTQGEFNRFCATLPHTHHVVQWGGADVWKVGKQEARSSEAATGTHKAKNKFKMFAIGWPDKKIEDDELMPITFHCSDIGYEMLKDTPGCRPAPYLASRGMTWIQRTSDEGVSDAALKDYLKSSHRLMAAKLTKTLQRELGLLA